MDQFTSLGPVQAVSKLWNSLTNTQKFVCAVFLATSIVLLIVVSVVATKPRMGVLFSGLDSQDAGTIVAKLQERKVPYDIAGDGSVLKVPTRDVHRMRLEMASSGLPQGGSVGFEIFDKPNLGITEFAQRMNYQRALQGELCRTINQLDNVEQARIHVAIPEPSVFRSEEKRPAASVVLKLRPGRELGAEQVGGIVHLVASAVEGMKPNSVTVVDTRGNLLSESSDDTIGLDPRLTAAQLQLKQNHERQMQQDIQSMLERVVGPNKAVVRVNAKIDFDRREQSSETYQPGGEGENRGILTSEQRLEESYGGQVAGVGGVVGIPANLRGGEPIGDVADRGYRRSETTSSYEVSKTTEHVVKAPGSLEQISLAVILDGDVEESRIPAIQSAVEAAAGIDTEKGDRVIVERVPFDDTVVKEQAEEMKALAARDSYLSIGKTAAGVILFVVFLIFLRGLFRQIKLSTPEQRPSPAAMMQSMAMATNPDLGESAPASASPSIPQANPEDVARVVREWISKQ